MSEDFVAPGPPAPQRWVCEVCGRLNREWTACVGCGATPRASGAGAAEVTGPSSSSAVPGGREAVEAGRDAVEAGREAAETGRGMNMGRAGGAQRREAAEAEEFSRAGDAAEVGLCPHCGAFAQVALDGALAQCGACGQLVWTGSDPRLPLERREVRLEPTPGQDRLRGRHGKRAGAGRRRRQGFGQPAIWVLFAAVVLMLGALSAILIVRERRDARGERMGANLAAPTDLSRQVPWLDDADLLAEVSAVISRYCGARHGAELVPVVIDGEALAARLDAWLSQERPEPIAQENLHLVADGIRRLEGDFWLVPVGNRQQEGLRRRLVLRVRAGACRVDWAGSEGVGELPWNNWLLRRPAEGLVMRLVAAESAVVLPPEVEFPPGARQITLRKGFETGLGVVAVVAADSAVARELEAAGVLASNQTDAAESDQTRAEAALGRGAGLNQGVAITVRAHFPVPRRILANGSDLVVLEAVLRPDWLAEAEAEAERDGPE